MKWADEGRVFSSGLIFSVFELYWLGFGANDYKYALAGLGGIYISHDFPGEGKRKLRATKQVYVIVNCKEKQLLTSSETLLLLPGLSEIDSYIKQ